MKVLGGALAGGKGISTRQQDDFYATNPSSLEDFLSLYPIKDKCILEPCVGQGHLAKVLKTHDNYVEGCDIVDRGYPNTIVDDFITHKFRARYNWVVTNPPFKIAKDFIDKALSITDVGVAMFLKIQFLESVSRKEWFQQTPLKFVYVFSKRQQPMKDGCEVNPRTNKPWSSTMCFAWFVWEHGYTGEPIIRWI